MYKPGVVPVFLLVAVLNAAPAWSQDSAEALDVADPPFGSLTTEQLQVIAHDIKRLENQPLASDAQEARHVLYNWLQSTPDVSVDVCNSLIVPLTDSSTPYQGKLLMQFYLSSAAFIVEHPEQADNPTAVHLSGLMGALNTYKHLKAEDGRKNPFMEKMEKYKQKKEGAKLIEFVTKELEDC